MMKKVAISDTKKTCIPKNIQKIIDNKPYTVDGIGLSGSKILCFDDMVLKIEASGEESDRERTMMEWLQGRLPVPQVLAFERHMGSNYLLMSKMHGRMACDESYQANPGEAIRLLAEGLKLLWAVDIRSCPCINNVENKLRCAEYRVKNNLCDVEHTEPETFGKGGFANPKALYRWLGENRPEEEPVLAHGDYCLPNIFFENGTISGYIDLGRAGVADKWQDIALCVRSIRYNFGTDAALIRRFFRYIEMEPDEQKIRYYVLMDELF